MSSLKKEEKEELEKAIGWEDTYSDAEAAVKRIDDAAVLNMHIIFLLFMKVFKKSHACLYAFLGRLLPLGFTGPKFFEAIHPFSKHMITLSNKREKLSKKKSAQPGAWENFLKSPFFFADSSPSNARVEEDPGSIIENLKRKMAEDSYELNNVKRSKKKADEKLSEAEKEIKKLQDKIESLNKTILSLRESNAGQLEEIARVKSSIGGTKSQLLRKDEKICQILQQDHPNCIRIAEKLSQNLYLGHLPGKFSKPVYFFNLGGKNKVPNSKLKSQTDLDNRVGIALTLLKLVSGLAFPFPPGDEGQNELAVLLKRILEKSSNSFMSILTKILVFPKISVALAVDLQASLKLTNRVMRKLRTFLNKVNLNFLPSEKSMQKQRAIRLRLLTNFVAERKALTLVGKEHKKAKVDILRAENIVKHISNVVQELKEEGRLVFKDPEDAGVKVLISGDKGGGLMKFYFQIANIKESSVFDVHMFTIYAGADDRLNIREVMEVYRDSLDSIHNGGALLFGYKGEVFLGGDYAFIDAALGHQGSTSSYPCAKDFVTLEHLRNHGSDPHTPGHCKVILRTEKDLEEDYNEKLAQGVGDTSKPKSGKEFNSITSRAAFPIPLRNVVPAILHIKLGIVQKLFELMLRECRKLDQSQAFFSSEEGQKMHQELKVCTECLQQKEKKLKALGEGFIDLCNTDLRFKTVLEDDDRPYLKTIAYNENKERLHKSEPPACDAHVCVLTEFDPDPWVQCDYCETWVHCLCDVLTNEEAMAFQLEEEIEGENDIELYQCTRCRLDGPNKLRGFVEERKCSCRKDQIKLEVDILRLSNKIKLIEQDNEQAAGPREKKLLEILDNLHVERQAFHSNSFVGNHCTIILNNYEALCEVFNDLPDKRKAFSAVFKVFADVQPLIRAKRYLTEAEKVEVRRLCNAFGVEFPKNFPESNLTRKMHEHIFHVPSFVEEHGTIGMFSEEEGEALHNIVNQELRQIACIRRPEDKYRHLIKRVKILGSADRRCVEPVSRLCQTCVAENKKVFLKKGKCPNFEQH